MTESFTDRDLHGARFERVDLTGVVMRAVHIGEGDIDAPWLLEGPSPLLVNGVDVAPYVESELNRRFPGRELRRASDPDGLREAWAALERVWAATFERVASMPPGTVEESVDGEWSFAQTLRHLVMATDVWLRQAILDDEPPFHPIGVPNAEYEADGNDPSVFSAAHPSYDEVLEVRAGRVALVREHLAGVTVEDLAVERRNPWAPEHHGCSCAPAPACLWPIPATADGLGLWRSATTGPTRRDRPPPGRARGGSGRPPRRPARPRRRWPPGRRSR